MLAHTTKSLTTVINFAIGAAVAKSANAVEEPIVHLCTLAV